jgi:hypothetical protein
MKWVILCKKSVGTPETLYWNNDIGWGDFYSATSFTTEQKKTLSLPIDGIWFPRKLI